MKITLQAAEHFAETADVETSSENYAARFAGSVGEWFLSIQRDVTLRMLAPYEGASVLDLGGGHGQVADALIQHKYQLTIAGSAPVCEARVKHLSGNQQFQFDVVDFLNLPYGDQSFDIVISYRLLPHILHWQRFLAEMSRVARTSIIFDYPEKWSINYFAPQFFQFKKQIEKNTRPYTCFSEHDLLAELQPHHFRLSERYPEFFLPMVLHRKLKNVPLSALLERVSRRLGLTQRFGSPVIMKLERAQSASSTAS